MSEPDLQNNFVSRDFHYEVVEAQAKRIAELERENAEMKDYIGEEQSHS